MFLCYDIIQDVPRLRSLSLSLTISPKVNSTKQAERTIRGLERTHPDTSCSPSAGSTTRNGVQGGNDVDGYSELINRCFLRKQLKPKALGSPNAVDQRGVTRYAAHSAKMP